MTDNRNFFSHISGIAFPNYTQISMGDWEAKLEETLVEQATIWNAARNSEFNYENTFGALERCTATSSKYFGPFALLVDGGNEDAMALYEKIAPKAATLSAEQLSDPVFARRCQDIFNRDHSSWPDYKQRAARQWLTQMQLTGALLPEDKRKRLTKIAGELSEKEALFQKMYGEACDMTLWLQKEALNGADISQMPVRDDGCIGVRLIREPVEEILEHCHVRETRRFVLDQFNKRGTAQDLGGNDTQSVIEDILRLRQEKADLLGYATFADLNMVNTMAENPSAAQSLIDRTWHSVADSASKHIDAIEVLAKDEGLDHLESWDTLYYLKKFEQAETQAEQPTVAQTLKAAFTLAERLFGLTFERVDMPAVWPGAKTWTVSRGGEVIGGMFTDFAARAGKPSGAWMHHLIAGHLEYGNTSPVVAMTCNFGDGETDPLSAQGVRTLFHEFGHALHGLLGRTHLPSQSGTNTLHDWVELPSQLLENWTTDDDCLVALGLPAGCGGKSGGRDEQIYKMRYMQAVIQDMAVHTRGLEGLTPDAFSDKVIDEHQSDRRVIAWHRLPHFSHLFSGSSYAAGYYGYLWAEVLDADVFTWVKQNGALDRQTGEALETFLYGRGDEQHPSELFRKLVGRDPDPNALVNRLGVAVEPQKHVSLRP